MGTSIGTTNTSQTTPEVIPDPAIMLISSIHFPVSTTIMSLPAFGLPIMREDFIVGTGPLQDARPLKQL